MYLIVLLYYFLLLQCDAKKSRLGGNNNRGTGLARPSSGSGQSGGFRQPNQGFNPSGNVYPNQPGGFHPNQPSGFHPNQPGGFHPNQPGGFRPNQGFHQNQGFQNRFNTGTGPGSVSRGSDFKKAFAGGLLGAATGLIAFEAGKAILRSATSPVVVNNKPYFFGDENYQHKNGYMKCSMPLEQLVNKTQASQAEDTNSTVAINSTSSPDNLLASIQFKDGSRPKSLVWGCKDKSEICCGIECCPAPSNNQIASSRPSIAGIIFGVLIALLLLICCCCCLVFMFFRSAFESCFPSSNVNNTTEDKSENLQYYNDAGQQTYPMQSYNVPQNYSTQGYAYPSQPYSYPNYPQSYPQNPYTQ